MRLNNHQIIAAAILMVSAGRLLAEEPVVRGQSYLRRDVVTRFGWWGVDVDGSPNNVGEWQGLNSSSPFFDVDGLSSDGYRTFDFFATGTEDESSEAGLYFYGGPRLSLDFDYDRFIHRLNHDPLGGVPDANGFPPAGGFFDPVLSDGDITPEQPGYPLFGQDLTVDQDYAIRVQDLDANFKGRLTENIRWRLNVWGMKKEGIRQANSLQHCFPATYDPPPPGGATGTSNTCHVVSQGQHINWLTMEIQPVIEARFGWLSAEYSHTIRSFQQSDQIVTNDFSRGVPYGFGAGAGAGAYAYVPENYTEIDRIKLRGELAPHTEMYVVGHVGNTHNEFRESDRKFYGADARVTNTSFDGLSITGYGKTFTQNNSPDTVSLNTRYPADASLWLERYTYEPPAPGVQLGTPVPPQAFYNPTEGTLYNPLVDREFSAVGLRGRWRPFHDRCGPASRLGLSSGYEYSQIERDNATYDVRAIAPDRFTQPDTAKNMFFVGLDHAWSATFDSYIRYRTIHTEDPLLGVVERAQLSLDAALNSNQPEQEDRVEIGGTWTPTDNFLLNASVWVQNRYNHSEFVDFDEDDYPIVVSAWYAPTCRWSFSGGYARFSNWINQDITLGREDGIDAGELAAWTTPWSYTGRSDVFNVGAAYLWSCSLKFTGGFEYVNGRNFFDAPAAPPGGVANADPPPATVDTYTDLPGYSRVAVDTYRVTAGVDYEWTKNIGTFLRYNYYDFDNQGAAYEAGTAHMVLAGVSAIY